MKTPKEYSNALASGILPKDLVGDVIYSFNKRAKNMRDKERKYREMNYNSRYGDRYGNEDKYREEKERYYLKKEKMLSFFAPKCIHCVTRTMHRTVDEYEIDKYSDKDGFHIFESFEKWDRDDKEYITIHRITFDQTDYYLYYEIGSHSFHTPIEAMPTRNTFDVIKLDELNTKGEDIGNLLSTQFCDKVLQSLMSGELIIEKE